MYRLEREEFVRLPYVSLWSILGFQAGFLNAFGFLACGRYVSHVTGMGTQVGVALADNRPWFALEIMAFPALFVLGALLSGAVTSARIERGVKPHYGFITLLQPLILLGLLCLGMNGSLGLFGEDLMLPRDFALLYVLCFVCGMQNGCFATMTKGQIRTTHLTGISTDIGTDLARLWFGKLEGQERALTRRTNFSRIATFLAFAAGSILSVKMSRDLAYGALVFPFMTSLLVWFMAQVISHSLDQKFRQDSGVQESRGGGVNPTPRLPDYDNRIQLA